MRVVPHVLQYVQLADPLPRRPQVVMIAAVGDGVCCCPGRCPGSRRFRVDSPKEDVSSDRCLDAHDDRAQGTPAPPQVESEDKPAPLALADRPEVLHDRHKQLEELQALPEEFHKLPEKLHKLLEELRRLPEELHKLLEDLHRLLEELHKLRPESVEG